MKPYDIQLPGVQQQAPSAMRSAQQQWENAFYAASSQSGPSTRFAGVVSGHAATLCCAQLKLSAGSSARAQWLQNQLQRFVLCELRTHVQKAAALSYVVLKPYVEGKNIACSIATPQNFVPTAMSGSHIQSGIFVDVSKQSGQTFIRLEEHTLTQDGVLITNKVYKKGEVQSGKELPLTAVEMWAGMAPRTFIKGCERPLFAVLKMPFANQIDPYSHLPVSFYAAAIDSFEKIDRLYNDFLWEMESGRRKQIFDITAVQQNDSTTQTNLAHYKTTDQFLLLDMGADARPYDDYSPLMRVQAYQEAINLAVRVMEAQLGMSAGTFSFELQGGSGRAVTATEVLAAKTDSYQTIKTIQQNGLKQGLLDLVHVYNIYASLYELAPKEGSIEPSVEFGEAVFEDVAAEFLRRKALADAGYESPVNLIAWYYDISPQQALQRMQSEPFSKGSTAAAE